jgi:hypothetical protein
MPDTLASLLGTKAILTLHNVHGCLTSFMTFTHDGRGEGRGGGTLDGILEKASIAASCKPHCRLAAFPAVWHDEVAAQEELWGIAGHHHVQRLLQCPPDVCLLHV